MPRCGTQDEALREKFTGNAAKVANLITFYAQEVREIWPQWGAVIDDVIGRGPVGSGQPWF